MTVLEHRAASETAEMNWERWASFEGYGAPISDQWATRMRRLVLHLHYKQQEINRLESELVDVRTERERSFHRHRATVTGAENHRKAEATAFVVELDAQIDSLESELKAAKAAKVLLEKAWDTERSHGSGVKEERRSTES